jgi:peptidoglycan/LPS O-acetylase OafA/YrhL
LLIGFLINSILLNAKKETIVSRSMIVKNFYIRRTLRIFPIYFLLLFFLYAVDYPDIRQYFWYFATYTANLLPYQTNTWNRYCHTWTLAIEEQFYLVWPWLIIYLKDKYLKPVFIAAIVTGIVTTYIGMSLQGHMEPFLVYNCFDAFGLGGLYAYVRLSGNARKFELLIKALAIPCLVLCIYWKMSIMHAIPMHASFLMKTSNGIIALSLIMLIVNNRSKLTERYFLGNKALNYIGRISYGLYLYHFPYIGYFCGKVNLLLYNITLPYPQLNKTIHDHHFDYWIQVAIMISISALSYKLIEKPLLKTKKRFSYYETGGSLLATSQATP